MASISEGVQLQQPTKKSKCALLYSRVVTSLVGSTCFPVFRRWRARCCIVIDLQHCSPGTPGTHGLEKGPLFCQGSHRACMLDFGLICPLCAGIGTGKSNPLGITFFESRGIFYFSVIVRPPSRVVCPILTSTRISSAHIRLAGRDRVLQTVGVGTSLPFPLACPAPFSSRVCFLSMHGRVCAHKMPFARDNGGTISATRDGSNRAR